MSIAPAKQPRHSWWIDGRPVVAIPGIIGLTCAILVFTVYVLLSKVLHAASYMPFIAGLVVAAIAPLWIRRNRKGLSQQATPRELALAVAVSAIVYVFASLFLILNVLGS